MVPIFSIKKDQDEIQYFTIIAVILLIAVSFTLMLSSNEADSPFVLTPVEGENKSGFSETLNDALMKRFQQYLEDTNHPDEQGRTFYWAVSVQEPAGKSQPEMKKKGNIAAKHTSNPSPDASIPTTIIPRAHPHTTPPPHVRLPPSPIPLP